MRAGQFLIRAATRILEGISRNVVIELAHDLELRIAEAKLRPYDLYVAEEAFLTTTSFCLLPITKFNNVRICGGAVGPIANTVSLHGAGMGAWILLRKV